MTLNASRSPWATACVDAFRLSVWSEGDRTPASEVWGVEQRLGSRARRMRAGVAGIVLGLPLAGLAFLLGLLLERWLDSVTDGGWTYLSRFLGDLGLLPFAGAGIGMLIALTGLYRLVIALVPWLARPGTAPALVRGALVVGFGLGVCFAVVLVWGEGLSG